MDSRLILPENTLLDGGYRIVRVLGTGGFGITYEAYDVNLRTGIALKEYYPFDFGDRDATMSVKPKSERHRQTFEWGRSSFLQEARTLARFDHPSIVRVARVFETNSTAYMVMRLEQGQSFEAWLKGLGRPPTQEELDRIAAPLLDALEIMHAEEFLHRDIAPDNIIVRANGTPVLLDFGAARRAVAEMSRSLTGIVKAGYSPQEQYASDGRMQGPWSDLYALGGTLYRAVAGRPPEEATLRVIEDHMPPAAQAAIGEYRPGFLSGIDACLRARHADRPQSVAELRPILLGQGPPAAPAAQLLQASRVVGQPSAPPARSASRRWLTIAAALALVGGAYGGFEYTRWSAAERARQEAEARQLADAARKKAETETAAKARTDAEAKLQQEARLAAERRVAEERTRQQAEAKRLADAAAAKKKTDDDWAAAERVQEAAEAKRRADAVAATQKKADQETQAQTQAKAQAEARRQAEAAAARKRSDDAWAAEERVREAAEAKRRADAAAGAQAELSFQQGERYLYGRGVARDYAMARQSYEKAAAGGHSGGMTGLGWIYENGLGVDRDYVKARELYEKAAASGNAVALNNLARLHRIGRGVPRDYAKARDLYEKSAAAGNSAGMVNLGWLHRDGHGVARDYGKARDWFEKAAATGNGAGMANIGWLYRDGHGVVQDYAKAREWFEKGAAAGSGAGMHGLGILHELGQGVPRDYAKAREWFEKSAAAGNDYGMNSLGWLHQNGFGVAQDDAKAREWYEKAVVTGNRFAHRNLAMLLDQGRGGPADRARAAKLLLEAARLNHAGVIQDLRGIMEKWSPKTREELKRELLALGHYKGPLHDVWNNDARAAVDKFLAAGK